MKQQLKLIPPSDLRPHPSNVRTHSKSQIAQIGRSIGQFGFTVPITADEDNTILAGHARWLAAKQLRLNEVPVITISGLSEAKKRIYLLADNKLTENAGWNLQALAVEFKYLSPLLASAGLDIELTGFSPSEIDGLLINHIDPESDPGDLIPNPRPNPISSESNLWRLREHRLLCGDARNQTHYNKLMGRERAAMVFGDPPYNVPTARVQGRGRFKHGNFAEGFGEYSEKQFTGFLCDSFRLAARYSIDGSIHYWCIDWRHQKEMLAAGALVYGRPKNMVVWVKPNAGMGTFYRSQHELIFLFKNGDAPHINNFHLGQHGRHRSNVWTYAGVNSFRAGRLDDLAAHPTVKPIALVIDAMRDCSRRGDIILDPFMGSGTTILAAERAGRRAYGIEVDPAYVDVAVRRWQNFTKSDAILDSNGRTFDEVARTRCKAARRPR
jgi:DNA modification methylase